MIIYHPCPSRDLVGQCRWKGGIPISDCDQVHECTCSNATVSRYQKRISGLLLDRIDIHIDVPWVEYEKLPTAG